MYRIRQQDLPFKGSSHEFVGADHGHAGISFFLIDSATGDGPALHRHAYAGVFSRGAPAPTQRRPCRKVITPSVTSRSTCAVNTDVLGS